MNHKIAISENDAVDMFISFLDKYSPGTISGDYGEQETEYISSNRDLYLMAEFIQSTEKKDYKLFEVIQRLSMAYLITTALTFDEPVETRTKEFSDITIYLDTPIVLRLLGLQTEELELAYKEMFRNFKESISPRFKIFQHTLDEISGIIADCANWIDNPAYNPSYANPALLNFIKRQFTQTQILLYQNSIVEKLQELDIEIDDAEYYLLAEQYMQIDTERLKSKLIETYMQTNPMYNAVKNERSIDYDIKSIENIVKLWGRKSSTSYSRLGYLFLTNNSTLSFVCRKFTPEYWWDSRNHKSPCMTDYYLGTMIWLSTPADKMNNISKLKLIADCSAATTLSKEVMERFSIELERLQKDKGIRSEDYLLLRKSVYEKNYLQNITLNEETAFKDDTIDQLLEDIKADIQKPLVETIQAKDSIITELQDQSKKQISEIASLKEKEEQKALEQKRIETELDQQTNQSISRLVNVYLPTLFSVFLFIFALLKVSPPFSKWNLLIEVFTAFVSLCSAIFFGMMKLNTFNLYNKLRNKIRKYYQIEMFKKTL